MPTRYKFSTWSEWNKGLNGTRSHNVVLGSYKGRAVPDVLLEIDENSMPRKEGEPILLTRIVIVSRLSFDQN